MVGGRKDFRRWLYRFLPATHPAFYPARRRGLDHGATRGGYWPVAEAQKSFLLRWVGPAIGTFREEDAGDGRIGSHAVWLEEEGWTGASFEERPEARSLLKKNRPNSCQDHPHPPPLSHQGPDLISARRESSIHRLIGEIQRGSRPRRIILQARDPQPEIFVALGRAGYRLDNFIHDDEYYRWKG